MPVLICSLHVQTVGPFCVPAADPILQAMTGPVSNGQSSAAVSWMIQRPWRICTHRASTSPRGTSPSATCTSTAGISPRPTGGGLVSRDALDAIAHAG